MLETFDLESSKPKPPNASSFFRTAGALAVKWKAVLGLQEPHMGSRAVRHDSLNCKLLDINPITHY